jgi:hypothetical protein
MMQVKVEIFIVGLEWRQMMISNDVSFVIPGSLGHSVRVQGLFSRVDRRWSIRCRSGICIYSVHAFPFRLAVCFRNLGVSVSWRLRYSGPHMPLLPHSSARQHSRKSRTFLDST